MGIAILVLGFGDAFHLVPRVLNYFVAGDFTKALGIGKFVTSITMTIFYVFMYYICCGYYSLVEDGPEKKAVYILTALRILVCLFPQNGWLTNESSMLWGTVRNIPFVTLGIIIIRMFYVNRGKTRRFLKVWLLITLSFAFYMPVRMFAEKVPMLGMLMLPKTVCYIILFFVFYNAVTKDKAILK